MTVLKTVALAFAVAFSATVPARAADPAADRIQVFYNALPALGKDGTLWNIQTTSPAAGHVFAKTGTYGAFDALNRDLMVTGKGLAGYTTTQEGRHLAFAIYANHVAVPSDGRQLRRKLRAI